MFKHFIQVLIALSPLLASCSEKPQLNQGLEEGHLLGELLSDQISFSLTLAVPHHCSWPEKIPPPKGLDIDATIKDNILHLRMSNIGPLRIGAVADSRGADVETLHRVARLRDIFISENVDLVVSLGGLATDAASIEKILAELTENAPYLVVAFPGDRESVPEHRLAVKMLVTRKRRVLDGSLYPQIALRDIVLLGLPGIARPAHLIANTNGCLYNDIDVERFRMALEASPKQVLLASYAPIANMGSDNGAGAIPVAAPITAPLADVSTLRAAIHGMVEPSTPIGTGTVTRRTKRKSIASGSLDPIVGKSSALLLLIDPIAIHWRRIEIP